MTRDDVIRECVAECRRMANHHKQDALAWYEAHILLWGETLDIKGGYGSVRRDFNNPYDSMMQLASGYFDAANLLESTMDNPPPPDPRTPPQILKENYPHLFKDINVD